MKWSKFDPTIDIRPRVMGSSHESLILNEGFLGCNNVALKPRMGHPNDGFLKQIHVVWSVQQDPTNFKV